MKKLQVSKRRGDIFIAPEIDFNPETGLCTISGESILEDTQQFYFKLIDWIKEYIDTKKKPIHFIFELTYFNTSSYKYLLHILNLLCKYEEEGGKVLIEWYYHENDINLSEEIDEFSELAKIDIKKIAI